MDNTNHFKLKKKSPIVDPRYVTNYNRSEEELESFLLFAVSVAGKTAKQISKALNHFLNGEEWKCDISSSPFFTTPFALIRYMYAENILEQHIRQSRLGQHNKLKRAFTEISFSEIDLNVCSVSELEQIHGIGKKTSRFFILHTRPNVRIACIDTHIKKWLSELGYKSKKYETLEAAFLDEADKRCRNYAELDLELWNYYSDRSGLDNKTTNKEIEYVL